MGMAGQDRTWTTQYELSHPPHLYFSETQPLLIVLCVCATFLAIAGCLVAGSKE